MTHEIYIARDGWRFQVKAQNGQTIAQAVRPYPSWQAARGACSRLVTGRLDGDIQKVDR